MAALFAFAAIVQFNDPDPLRWIAVYTAASLLSLAPLIRRRLPPVLFASVAIVSCACAAAIVAGAARGADYLRMFDAWEMSSAAVEEAREATGLFIAGAWMAALTAWSAVRRAR